MLRNPVEQVVRSLLLVEVLIQELNADRPALAIQLGPLAILSRGRLGCGLAELREHVLFVKPQVLAMLHHHLAVDDHRVDICCPGPIDKGVSEVDAWR